MKVNWRSIVRKRAKLHESTIRKCPRFQGIAATVTEPLTHDQVHALYSLR